MIGHNNTIDSLTLQCDRCGKTSNRDDCNLNKDHWTLHCPACGEELDMINADDMRRRSRAILRAKVEAEKAERERQAEQRAERRRRIRQRTREEEAAAANR